MATTTQRIQLRRDTAANWTTNNPTLQAGELGFETDTGKFKIGTGSTAWTSLAYASILPGAAAIVNADVSASAAIAGTKISPDFGSQNITTTGNATAASLTPSAGTTTKAPLVLTSGTNLTTAAAGAIEYDGTHFFATPNTTSGRGHIPARQSFQLASNGSNVGATIGDFYGSTSAINLVASAVYEIDFLAYFLKNTAGTATWTLTASSAPTLITGFYHGSPVTGIAAGTPITGYAGSRGATTAAFSATASITDAVYMAFDIRCQVITNAATTFKLQITQSAGTVTPQAGSFYTVRRVAATTGSFA